MYRSSQLHIPSQIVWGLVMHIRVCSPYLHASSMVDVVAPNLGMSMLFPANPMYMQGRNPSRSHPGFPACCPLLAPHGILRKDFHTILDRLEVLWNSFWEH